MTSSTGPLAGLKVLDLTINILGPVATQVLGDMGADVIKVEAPRGDPNRDNGPRRSDDMAAFFLGANRNKRSVVLDLKQPSCLAALMRMAQGCDIFVHGMRHRAALALGIGYEAVRAHNRKIVYANAPGYSSKGRYRDRGAYDDVIQGECGIASLQARASGAPAYVPTALADKLVGIQLALAIGMAMVSRERTGEGQQVEVPMLETMVSFNLLEHIWGASFVPPLAPVGYPRQLSRHRRPYQTEDGYISMLAVTDEQWAKLFEAMRREDMRGDPRFASMHKRNENIDLLYATVAQELKKKTTAEWKQVLDASDIPNAIIPAFEDLPSDPYLNEVGLFEEYDHPSEGRMVNVANPTRFSGTPIAMHRPPPRLGQHSREVFEEFGFSAREIDGLMAGAA